jgi:hypothetical protein
MPSNLFQALFSSMAGALDFARDISELAQHRVEAEALIKLPKRHGGYILAAKEFDQHLLTHPFSITTFPDHDYRVLITVIPHTAIPHPFFPKGNSFLVTFENFSNETIPDWAGGVFIESNRESRRAEPLGGVLSESVGLVVEKRVDI